MDQIFQIVEAPILSHKVKMDSEELFFFLGPSLKFGTMQKLLLLNSKMFLTTIKQMF